MRVTSGGAVTRPVPCRSGKQGWETGPEEMGARAPSAGSTVGQLCAVPPLSTTTKALHAGVFLPETSPVMRRHQTRLN